jgi:hypothetical protein
MVLGPHKERVILPLRNLHPLPSIVAANNLQARAFNLGNKVGIYFVPVAMAFDDVPVFDQVRSSVQLLYATSVIYKATLGLPALEPVRVKVVARDPHLIVPPK